VQKINLEKKCRIWTPVMEYPKQNTYYERKRIKNGTDQHEENQQQTEKGLTIGHLECTITV
jgi:hypothetical protein